MEALLSVFRLSGLTVEGRMKIFETGRGLIIRARAEDGEQENFWTRKLFIMHLVLLSYHQFLSPSLKMKLEINTRQFVSYFCNFMVSWIHTFRYQGPIWAFINLSRNSFQPDCFSFPNHTDTSYKKRNTKIRKIKAKIEASKEKVNYIWKEEGGDIRSKRKWQKTV